MKTVARIIADLKDEAFILQDGTSLYFDKLRNALVDIKNDKHSDYLHFAFVTLSSATLEYCLNHILITSCIDEFGPKEYKQFAETYINMPFRKKLIHTPYIVSKGKLLFDETTSSFQVLADLISLRNNLLHTKEYLQKIDAPFLNLEYLKAQSGETVEFSIKIKKQRIELIDKKVCLQIADAIGDFKNLFMAPFLNHQLTANNLLKEL